MKTSKIMILLILSAFIITIQLGCKKGNVRDCSSAITEFEDEISRLYENPDDPELCQQVKRTLNDLYKDCKSNMLGITQAQIDELCE